MLYTAVAGDIKAFAESYGARELALLKRQLKPTLAVYQARRRA